jgi:hypothetical protein
VTPTGFVGSVLKTAGGRFCGLGPQNSGRFSRQHMVTISALSLCILISISLMNHEKLFRPLNFSFQLNFIPLSTWNTAPSGLVKSNTARDWRQFFWIKHH